MASIDPNKANGSSNNTRSFITALAANGALLAIEVGVFVFLKKKLGRIYSPRTYLPPPEKRADPLPEGYWQWLPAVIRDNPEDIIHKNGLDAYMFLRFIKMLIWIFALFTVLTLAIIAPIDAVGIPAIQPGLDEITWTNVYENEKPNRFWAHLIMVYVLTFCIFFLIRKEMLHFVHMRHKFLNSKTHSRLAQARTVLITNVPNDLSTERELRVWASFAPGGVDRVWLYRDSKALNEMFEEREKLCGKLEKDVVKVLKEATVKWRMKEKVHKKERKRRRKAMKRNKSDVENGVGNGNGNEEEKEDLELPEATDEFMNELIPANKRPTARSGPLGLCGNKFDAIEHYRDEISRLNKAIDDGRKNLDTKAKFLGSAFIRCNIQMGASVLAQCVSYHEPGKMINKWMEANPKDVVWRNLDDGQLEMRTRAFTSWLATLGLIIGWAFPAAFIGGLSNSDELCEKAGWLRWICEAPKVVQGIITGILPPVLLAIVFALLPFILRALAWYECIPRWSLISVSVYKRFYLFLLLHGFLIVTVSSGLTNALEEIIANPTNTIQALASRLPGASVFFLTYMVTQGLAGAGNALAQLVPIVFHFIRKFFLGRTPRQAYGVTFLMPACDFGLALPRMSLLATIGFAYSVLTPFLNFMALLSFMMYYLAWKFLFTQVFDQPDEFETGGLYYPMAMSNLFVGLYIEQLCLACLFFIKTSTPSMRVSSIVEGCLMILLIIITIFFHFFIRSQFEPITNYLPMSMATKKMAKRFAKQQQKRGVNFFGKGGEEGDDLDMFAKSRFHRARKHIQHLPKALDNKLADIKATVKGETRPSEEVKRAQARADDDAAAAATGKKRDDEGESHDIADVSPSAATSAVAARPAVEGAPELFKQPSVRSNASKMSVSSRAHSESSSTSKKSKSKDEDKEKKSHPVFDPPAPALSDTDDDDSDDDDSDSDDEHAFDHPSTYKDQPFIWIPEDRLGLSKLIIEDLKKAGVAASDLGSTMNAKGVVEVTRGPPDVDWQGGHDR